MGDSTALPSVPRRSALTLCLCASVTTGAFSCGHDFGRFEGVFDGGADASASLDGGGLPVPDVTDGGSAAPDGRAATPDAGPGGDTTQIACGAATCSIPADSCCVSELGNRQTSYDCVTTATCPRPSGGGSTAALKCSGQANCSSGTVCCVQENNGNAASTCKSSCGSGEAQLCDPAVAGGGGCPSAARCSNKNIGDWGNLPNSYATCGGRAR
jgi:hypothetical protein